MRFGSGLLIGITGTLLAGVTGILAWLIASPPKGGSTPSKPPPAAVVPKVLNENELNTVTLTQEAEDRLDVRTEAITRKPVNRTRTYGGEVVVPAGRSILVAAPLPGILQAPSAGLPAPGGIVKKGQAVLMLFPLLTPEARTTLAAMRVEADGQVNTARTQYDAARIALERAQRLLREEAGSKRSVDETQAQHDLAQKTMEAAEARRDLLTKTIGELAKGTAAPIVIEAPEDGLLRSLSALPGQSVPTGASLFEVADLARVWIRVSVYVGDLPEVDETAVASIAGLAEKPAPHSFSARPVTAPPTAAPLAATADLYYGMDNSGLHLIPGQRVAATLKLKGEIDGLTVPWSAIVHDYHGGTWVYERVKEHTYLRRRVAVKQVVNGLAVLSRGPSEGAPVVVAGAQEIFGAETGFSK